MEPIKELEERVLTILNEDPSDQFGSDVSFNADKIIDTTSPTYNNSLATDISNSMDLIEDEDKVKCIDPSREEFGQKFIFSHWADDTRQIMICMDENGNMSPSGTPYEFNVDEVKKVNIPESNDDSDDDDDDESTSEKSNDNTESPVSEIQLNDTTEESLEQSETPIETSTETQEQITETTTEQSMEEEPNKEQMTLESLTMSVLYNIQECDNNGAACPKAKEDCKNCDQEQKDEPTQPTKKTTRPFVTKKETEVQESFEEMKARKLTEAKEKGFSV
jgi:hypothetical protein